MCRHIHGMLSAEDQKDVKKLSGVMIPVYASIVLAMIAMVNTTGDPPRDELVASTSPPASAR